ncbi:extensin family protein [Qipengyuania marisflavi]|uniref:Extensin family protein n=1 Tax=Qipengyuania marisflavi TaxID=2486356 RepID=A0A5S3PFU5_9SPHN|nr:extensin family protein [Qipengyuania marisflavi]TMM50460.1 extensin family protein [Qipengyuania marisflavi]
MLLALLVGGRTWLAAHPQHDPWAPLDLRHPEGWATEAKLLALRSDTAACRAVLERSEIGFAALAPAGEGDCRREDRTRLTDYPLSPATPPMTCLSAVALKRWKRDVLESAAQDIFGSKVEQIEHLGAYSCRRLYGRNDGPWSEHATANAIDIAGFVLADGTRISVLRDWQGEGDKARFLREIRDGACGAFATVLSPDYNAAHRDHLHLDMTARWSSVCR